MSLCHKVKCLCSTKGAVGLILPTCNFPPSTHQHCYPGCCCTLSLFPDCLTVLLGSPLLCSGLPSLCKGAYHTQGYSFSHFLVGWCSSASSLPPRGRNLLASFSCSLAMKLLLCNLLACEEAFQLFPMSFCPQIYCGICSVNQ